MFRDKKPDISLGFDSEFMLEVVRKNGLHLIYANEKSDNYRDIVLEAVKQNGDALEYASEDA